MSYKKRTHLLCTDRDKDKLLHISKSKTEEARKVQRAKLLLLYLGGMSIPEIGKQVGLSKVSVYDCVDKALSFGAIAALDDLSGRGVSSTLNDEDHVWVTSIACSSPGDYGYANETWTYSLLVDYIKKNCEKAGYPHLKKAGKSLVYGILNNMGIKPHKIEYYLERRDELFEEKMAQVLAVYKDVAIINKEEEQAREKKELLPTRKRTTISFDEKPGIQALKNIGVQLLPVPFTHMGVDRDYEYKRLGTLNLLAAIDLHSGQIIPLVTKKHRSEEFIAFLKKAIAAYPSDWKIRVILDNHSAHKSKTTMKYIESVPGKFEFVFTPTHGSWLNMIEMFFSKIARGFLRDIRVDTIKELEDRIYLGLKLLNEEPVVFHWKYKIEDALVSNA